MGILSVPRYMTAQDVQLRLNKTVVMYRGHPVYVGQGLMTEYTGADDLTLDVFDLIEQRWLPKVHSSDEELEVKAQYLGYFNLRDGRNIDTATYAARLPCRRQRQGLSQENCYIYNLNGNILNNRMDNIHPSYLKMKSFGEMMMNEYPKFEECLKQLKDHDRCKARAFGRKLLITEDEIGLIKLHYFTTAIGVWNPKRKQFSLPEQFEHYIPIMKSHDVPCGVYD